MTTTTTTIVGCQRDTHCDHCGRPLKYGIEATGIGTIGADCLVARLTRTAKRRWRGGPNGSDIRKLALAAERQGKPGNAGQEFSPQHFRLEVTA